MGIIGPGSGHMPIWLSGLQCEGNETSLADCPHNGWDTTSCTHAEDVSVTCVSNPLPGTWVEDRRVHTC